MAKKASSRNAQGAGTIRKKTVTRNGKPYTYWEARYTRAETRALESRCSGPFMAGHKRKCGRSCRR